MINRKIAPEIQGIIEPQFGPVLKIENEWDIPFYVVKGGAQEVIKLEFIFDAGTRLHPNIVVSSLANSMLPEGTSRHNASEIAEWIDRHGAFLETDIEKDYATASLFTLNKFFADTLQLFSEVVFDASFPENEFDIMRKSRFQRFKVNMEKVSFLASRKFSELMFGASSYGYIADESDYQSLTRQDSRDFYQQHYREGNVQIYLCGNVTDADIELVKKLLSNMNRSNSTTHPTFAYEKGKYNAENYYIEKPGSLQSAIRIGRPLFTRNHPDYYGMKILNVVLGGYFGSRLMKNIREDKGYTYGIGSGIGTYEHDGFFYIATEVGADVTNQALDEIYKEINMLCQERIANDELNLVRQYMIGNMLKSFDGPFEQMERFRTIQLMHSADDFYERYFDTIHNITSDQLLQLAQQYFKKSDLTELVVGVK
ncbi:MAG: M16 family metallopeptidase [Flavobacteriales bacterium]